MRSRPSLAAGSERASLLRAAALALRSDGWSEVRAAGCPEFREPQALVVPVLHAPVQPDLCASHPRRPGPLVASVATRRELGDPMLARRWQALAQWAREHRGAFAVFVVPEDQASARAAAVASDLDPSLVRVVRPLPPPSPARRPAVNPRS